MKNAKGDDWYPFYVDKWLFGSTRLEFEPDERSVWIDLLTLSKKDQGFIRANENCPYSIQQLAGLFVVSPELLQNTIKKAISNKKLKQLDDGCFYVTSTEKYELSKRQKRRLKEQMSAKTDTMADSADGGGKKSQGEESRREEKRESQRDSKEKNAATPLAFPIASLKERQEIARQAGIKKDA